MGRGRLGSRCRCGVGLGVRWLDAGGAFGKKESSGSASISETVILGFKEEKGS